MTAVSDVVCSNCGARTPTFDGHLPAGWLIRSELIPMTRQQRRDAKRKGRLITERFYACSIECAKDADAKANRVHKLYDGPLEFDAPDVGG